MRYFNLNKNNSLYFWALFYAFSIFCIVMLNIGNTFVRTLGFILFLCIGFLLSKTNLLLFIAAIEPLSNVYKFNGGYTVLPFLFIVLFFKLVSCNRELSRKKLITLLSINLISTINYLIRGFSLGSYLSFFVCFLCFIWMSEDDTFLMEDLFYKIIWIYTISTLIECFCSAMLPNVTRMLVTVSQYNQRNVGFSSEWNYGRHIVVSIAFLFCWIKMKKNDLLLCTCVILYLSYSLIKTGLYSGLVALVFLVLMVPFMYDGSLKQRICYSILTLFVAIIGLFIIYKFVFLPMKALRGQFSDNGRFDLWQLYYMDFIKNKSIFLFGIGAGAIQDYAGSISRLTTHNTIIEKVFEFGIFGIVLLLCLIKECFRKHGLSIRKNYRLIPLFTFFGTCLTQGVSGEELIFILMILGL